MKFLLYFIAALVGVIAGVMIWFAASRWVASSILWAESRYPRLAGSKSLRAYEAVVCGLLVFFALALAFLIARLLVK